jgi:hypothetical protein
VISSTTLPIQTLEGANEFQVRFFKEEGIGLLTTRTEKNYLVLDSLEYWYDLIQNEYPKKKKCSCKNEWFTVQFAYEVRKDTSDFRSVTIRTTCISCRKSVKAMTIDIDYSPTDHLLTHPLTYCEQPNIKYKFNELNSYWSGNDLPNFLAFIFNDLKLNVYCWFFRYPEGKRFFQKVNLKEAIEIITINHKYLDFYFSERVINPEDMIAFKDENGVYLKRDIWRKNEFIKLSSPIVISNCGSLYYISYCNQYLVKTNVIDKSKQFEHITSTLNSWLKSNFITKRGVNCFDGHKAYEKYTKAATK